MGLPSTALGVKPSSSFRSGRPFISKEQSQKDMTQVGCVGRGPHRRGPGGGAQEDWEWRRPSLGINMLDGD